MREHIVSILLSTAFICAPSMLHVTGYALVRPDALLVAARARRALPPHKHLIIILHLDFLSTERYPCAHRVRARVSNAAQALVPCARKVQWSASISLHARCDGDLEREQVRNDAV